MRACERRWLTAICEAMLPGGTEGGLPFGAERAPYAALLDDVLSVSPPEFRLGLRAATWVTTFVGPLLIGRIRRFTALPHEEQVAVLDALAASRFHLLREVPVMIKFIACFGYCALPEVQRAIGFADVDPAAPAWTRQQP